jgi:hypothetical protein
MNIFERLGERDAKRMEQTVAEWDREAVEHYLKLLELAYNQPGQLVHTARAHAPEAFARVGTPATKII